MKDPPPPNNYFLAVYSLPLITFSEIDWLPPAGGYDAFSCSRVCVHKLPEGEKLNGTCAMQHPLCEKVGAGPSPVLLFSGCKACMDEAGGG